MSYETIEGAVAQPQGALDKLSPKYIYCVPTNVFESQINWLKTLLLKGRARATSCLYPEFVELL